MTTTPLTDAEKDRQPQHLRGRRCAYCATPAATQVYLIPIAHTATGSTRTGLLRAGEPVCTHHALLPETWYDHPREAAS